MGWKRVGNAAQYENANWANFVSKQSNTTATNAMRMACADPSITFFFFCREAVLLTGSAAQYGPFMAGDAVFFTGDPWFGSAAECDSYQKTGLSTIYINPVSNQQFTDIGRYVLPDGTPAVDIVCLFAANYASNDKPCLRAYNNDPVTTNPFNPNIQAVLSKGLVGQLQAKGISVLVTITNAFTSVGWSEFTDQGTAQNFVDYLRDDVVGPYGLDGIDIDDEYSRGTANLTSLPMVTALMKQSMPSTLITKALWNDGSVFQSEWNGHTLAGNLTYGWEMTYYGGDAGSRLGPYLTYGMQKSQLSLGFSAETKFQPDWPSVGPEATKTVASDGYAGCMMFDYENQPASIALMQAMVDGMDGPGSWTSR
jgi:hypothetical protein